MLDFLIYLNQWVWAILGLMVGLPIVVIFLVSLIISIVVLISSIFLGVSKWKN